MDSLVECGWEKRLTVEAFKTDLQSFMREKRQLENHFTRERLDVGNILASPAQKSGFRGRRQLHRLNCK